MIGEIFASETLYSILAILYKAPGKRYYVNNLIKLSGRFPRSVQLALAKLERAGVVSSERKANLKYFWANQEHPAFNELHSLLKKTAAPDMLVRDHLAPFSDRVRFAFAYGDAATKTLDELEELDLVLVGDLESGAMRTHLDEAEGRLGKRINFTVIAPQEWERQISRPGSLVSWLNQQPKRMVLGSEASQNQPDATNGLQASKS